MKKIFSALMTLATVFMLSSSAFADSNSVFAIVKEYLCAPSPYTNTQAYGQDIQGTLSDEGSLVSLGSFGGYAVFEFNEPIYNNKASNYGIDFKIVGNSFNSAYTTQEPGQVWVSQDGENWYALAGSEHYENKTVWDYSVVYKNSGNNTVSFKDNYSNEGTIRGSYPSPEFYSTVSFSNESLTLSGILLAYERESSTSNGVSTSFGYVDSLSANKSKDVKNPYCENTSVDGIDGQFDIDWAVDKDGYPVNLSWVKYVKVQSATLVDGGAFGEKSTEISKVIVLDENETQTIASSECKITVNGEDIGVTAKKTVYDVSDLAENNELNIAVEADGADVYINNSYSKTRAFNSATQKCIIRVIIQKGEAAPLIYYLKTNKSNDTPFEPYTPEEEHIKGESVNVSFSFSNGDTVIPKCNLFVDDGLGELYGYDVAKKDHNSKPIDGVTVFDVIVAAHKAYYGEKFTAENCKEYLVMNKSFITKAFGKSASSSGFLVNYMMPNDTNESLGQGMSICYACDTARVKDGDFVSYYFYQDKSFWSDNVTYFDKASFSALTGESVTLTIKAYPAMHLGAYNSEVIDEHTLPAAGVKVYYYDENNNQILLGEADGDGRITVSFDKAGSYKLFTGGIVCDESENECSIIPGWCEAEIKQKEMNLWDKIVAFFKSIIEWIIGFINKLFGIK